jgi:hypothetical protein
MSISNTDLGEEELRKKPPFFALASSVVEKRCKKGYEQVGDSRSHTK